MDTWKHKVVERYATIRTGQKTYVLQILLNFY
uniref:Uncharacterized protein n=1 Tax=Arundo donax TaxID=35708 RepID=A0A0A9FXW5_ARUDO